MGGGTDHPRRALRAGLTERWEQVWHQIDLLHEHPERETETIRSVDSDASEVPVNERFDRWSKLELALSHQILEVTGKLPQRTHAGDQSVVKSPLTDHDVIAVDADGNFHAVQQ